MPQRFKNYGLWASVLAFIPILLEGIGVDVLPDNYSQITESVLSILVLAGIISNPTTSSKWYKDDHKNPEKEK